MSLQVWLLQLVLGGWGQTFLLRCASYIVCIAALECQLLRYNKSCYVFAWVEMMNGNLNNSTQIWVYETCKSEPLSEWRVFRFRLAHTQWQGGLMLWFCSLFCFFLWLFICPLNYERKWGRQTSIWNSNVSVCYGLFSCGWQLFCDTRNSHITSVPAFRWSREQRLKSNPYTQRTTEPYGCVCACMCIWVWCEHRCGQKFQVEFQLWPGVFGWLHASLLTRHSSDRLEWIDQTDRKCTLVPLQQPTCQPEPYTHSHTCSFC